MKNILIAIGAAGAVVITSATAAAQGPTSRPDRPYRGLFGARSSDAAEVLSVSGSLGAGYDTDVVAEVRDFDPERPDDRFRLRDAAYSVASGGISYARNTEKVGLGASVFSSARYYPDASNFVMVSHAAAIGGSVQATRSTQVSAGQTVMYQPFQVMAYFPTLFVSPVGEAVIPNQDFATGANEYWTYASSAGITQQLSGRSTLTAGYTYTRSKFTTTGAAAIDDFTNQTASVRYARGITRNLGWHAGYGYIEAQYSGPGGRYRGDTIDTGLDYSRSFSVTRRTQLTFSTGAMALKQGKFRRYDAMGTAVLNREIGRSWLAGVGYTRNVTFIESLGTPYFYDGVNAALTGFVNRRVSVSAGAGATFGQLGFNHDEGSGRFDTGYANAGLAYAISRHLAVGVDYVFYAYLLGRPDQVSYGLTPNLSRHGVRVSLNAWAPIFERGRRRNATR